MQVNSVSSASSSSSTQTSTTQSTSERELEFGQDAFMKLLLTQLKYQDPLSPMEDREFISQLAQFTSLSELQKLNDNFSQMTQTQALASGTAFIGKTVSGLSSDGEEVTGVAEAAILRESKVYLRVSGSQLSLDTITEVTTGGSDA